MVSNALLRVADETSWHGAVALHFAESLHQNEILLQRMGKCSHKAVLVRARSRVLSPRARLLMKSSVAATL